jgi:hypothetical protein
VLKPLKPAIYGGSEAATDRFTTDMIVRMIFVTFRAYFKYLDTLK